MSEITIGIGVTGRVWRGELQRHVRDHTTGVALRLIGEARQAREEQLDVLLVDDDLSWLSRPLVVELQARGVVVVGIHDPDEDGEHGRESLARKGIDDTLPATTEPGEVIARVRGLLPATVLLARFGEVVAGLELDEPTRQPGRIVAVAGPPGAGQTEIAVALAASLARRQKVILVDADEHRPGVARRLQRGLSPNILSAIDGLRSGTIDGSDPILSSLAVPGAGGDRLPFHVLCGLAHPKDWVYLRPQDVEDLLDELARRWDRVIVTVGPELEDLTRYVDRSPATHTTLARADEVIAVCEPSPRGVLRFLDWLVELDELSPRRSCTVVVNRTPRSGFVRAELEEQLRSTAGRHVARIVFVPDDRRVTRASWDGRLVGRGRFGRGRFIRAVAELAGPFTDSPNIGGTTRRSRRTTSEAAMTGRT